MKKVFPFILILLFLAMGRPAYAFLYQGQLAFQTHYLLEGEFSKIICLELEVGEIVDFNKLLYLRHQFKILMEKDEVTLDHEIRESFIHLALEQVGLRMGKQLISSGSSYGYNPTQNFIGQDLTFIGEKGRGVEAVLLQYNYSPYTSLTGIMAWEFSPHHLKEGSVEGELRNALKEMGFPIPEDINIKNPTLVGPADYQYGLIYQGEFSQKFNLSLSLFSGYEQYPRLTKDDRRDLIGGENLQDITLTYKGSRGLGFDVRFPLWKSILWLEAYLGENEEEENSLELVLGGEYKLGESWQILLQYYHRNDWDSPWDLYNEGHLLLRIKRPFFTTHSLCLKSTFQLPKGTLHINPELTLRMKDEMAILLGGTIEGFDRRMDQGQLYIGITLFF